MTFFPKGEVHLHLRGAAPKEYFLAQITKYLGRKDLFQPFSSTLQNRLFSSRFAGPILKELLSPGIASPEEILNQLFSYSSFDQFLESYITTASLVRSAEDFSRLLSQTKASLRQQGYRFCEVTVSLSEYLMMGIPLLSLLEQLVLSRSSSKEPYLLFTLDPVRNFGALAAENLLQDILQYSSEVFSAVTIGGDETNFPGEDFAHFFSLARESGLKISIHSGETCGPAEMWRVIERISPDRIGHGVRAAEDPKLLEYLAERQIPLEVCISSNLRTGVFPALHAVPLQQIVGAGIPVTLNTDDPTFFATTLENEFELAQSLCPELTQEDLCKLNFEASFLPNDLRERLLRTP